MRWTTCRRKTGGLARTVKSCGPGTQSRCQVGRDISLQRRRWLGLVHRGEHEGTRKTIARGMPGVSGVTVVTTLVCSTYTLHTRLRAHQASGIPCALCLKGGRLHAQSGRIRAAEMRNRISTSLPATNAKRLRKGALATKQSIFVIPGRCEASNPESRDSGSGPADHPGMTGRWLR
jgi:hypothetical protein